MEKAAVAVEASKESRNPKMLAAPALVPHRTAEGPNESVEKTNKNERVVARQPAFFVEGMYLGRVSRLAAP